MTITGQRLPRSESEYSRTPLPTHARRILLAGSDLGLFFFQKISNEGCSKKNAKEVREVFDLHNKDVKEKKMGRGEKLPASGAEDGERESGGK